MYNMLNVNNILQILPAMHNYRTGSAFIGFVNFSKNR